jgi:polysaccharide pyruvyl transferase CsaB
LKVFVQQLQSRALAVTVLSQAPAETQSQFGQGVAAVPRLSPLAILGALRQTDLFISGGGGLLQDVTGLGSVLYYGGLMVLARMLGKPVLVLGQGVGPLKKPFTRWLTGQMLQTVQGIAVRDAASVSLVKTISGRVPVLAADTVWLLPSPTESSGETPPSPPNAETPLVTGLSLRRWRGLDESALAHLAGVLTDSADGRQHFRLFSFHASYDDPVLAILSDHLAQLGHTVERVPEAEVLSKLPGCHRFLGMRFHSLVLALLYGIPVFGLSYDPKITQLLSRLNLSGIFIEDWQQLRPEILREYFNQYPMPDLTELKADASLNFRLLDDLLEATQSHAAS